MKLNKIISGVQTGADRAGLDVALKHGLETGGTMPFGYKAQDGCHPEFKEKYKVTFHSSSSYVPRTKLNVEDSDGTIRLAYNFESAGEVLTLKAIVSKKKPHIDVDLSDPIPVDDVLQWLEDNDIETLNVAGNAEATASGTYDATFDFLDRLLQKALA